MTWCYDLAPASPLNVCVTVRGDAALIATSDEFAHITAAIQAST